MIIRNDCCLMQYTYSSSLGVLLGEVLSTSYLKRLGGDVCGNYACMYIREPGPATWSQPADRHIFTAPATMAESFLSLLKL